MAGIIQGKAPSDMEPSNLPLQCQAGLIPRKSFLQRDLGQGLPAEIPIPKNSIKPAEFWLLQHKLMENIFGDYIRKCRNLSINAGSVAGLSI